MKKTRKSSKKARKTTTNADIYQMITDRIVSKLEEGTIPWRKPWSSAGVHVPPQNLISRKPYRGINVFLTSMQGYASPFWLTFKQAQDLGGHVKKGEKGTPIVFFQFVEKSTGELDPETGEEQKDRIPVLKYFTVFNALQCELPMAEAELIPQVETTELERIEAAQQIVDGMPNRPRLATGGDRAFYRWTEDVVSLPPMSWFDKAEEYYSTLFHELGHSTGHPSRLSRESLQKIASFGDHTYSKEELVAEFTASFLCGTAGIERETLENSSAYIASWLKRLKDDPKMLIWAAGQAQKAADYVLSAAEVVESECAA